MGNPDRESGSSEQPTVSSQATTPSSTSSSSVSSPTASAGSSSTTQRPPPPPPPYESLSAAVASVVRRASFGTIGRNNRRRSLPENLGGSAVRVTDDAGVVGNGTPTSNATTETAAVTVWERVTEEESRRQRRGTWQHDISYVFATISCVVGMYNISRFAMMVYLHKGYFLFEFLVLTMILGVPFLYAMMTLGQFLGSGMLDMWYISPAFKGLGFALMYLYAIVGMYTTIPLSWMFVYFKDSFITTREHYRWALCQPKFAAESCIQAYNSSSLDVVGWTAPSYFNGRVLDRKSSGDDGSMGDLRFEIAFHLAIIWLLVFVCLSRGLRSLGKVVFVLGTLPVALLLLVAIRFMEQWSDGIGEIFSEAGRSILTDSVSWLLAAREVFMIWGMNGAAVLHLSSHNKLNCKVTKNLIAIVTVVLIILITGALLCISAMQIITDRNLVLVASSFEDEVYVKFLQLRHILNHADHNKSTINFFVGGSFKSPAIEGLSGYQVVRLAVEVMPAALALEGVRNISSFWAICFYGMMILFALGQHITIWFCVVESIIALKPKVLKPWQTIITFITCNIGFLLGLPMTTNIGIFIVFFIDFSVGSLWWIVVLYLISLVAVFFIRGHPYGTDQLVTVLTPESKTKLWLLPLLTFLWNVVLPVSCLVLAITFLRWTPLSMNLSALGPTGNRFWPVWLKKMSFFVQILPLAVAASVCSFKAYLYLAPKSQQPLHERIQLWCCPIFAPATVLSSTASPSGVSQGTSSPGQGIVNSGYEEDPPPKYTPPPSYSTATSKLVIKQLMKQTNYRELEAARVACATIGMQSNSLPGVELVSYDPQPDNVENRLPVSSVGVQ